MNHDGDSFLDFILDQLSGLNEEVRCKRMFGAHGLYLGQAFIGILDEGALYLKADKMLLQSLAVSPIQAFSYPKKTPDGKIKTVQMRYYYLVPAEMLEDRRRLKEWAQKAAKVLC